jgi:hypothetical protein
MYRSGMDIRGLYYFIRRNAKDSSRPFLDSSRTVQDCSRKCQPFPILLTSGLAIQEYVTVRSVWGLRLGVRPSANS